MAGISDSITLGRPVALVRAWLEDLAQHPSFVPDGFKHYRILSRETRGLGARAAIEIDLLGHWLPAELSVQAVSDSSVTLRCDLEPALLTLSFMLKERGERTQVDLTVQSLHKRLPMYRLRTRIKQKLRLDSDVANLVARFLSALKETLERSEGGKSEGAAAHPARGAEASGGAGAAGGGAVPVAGTASGPTSANTGVVGEAASGQKSGGSSAEVDGGDAASLGDGQSRIVTVGTKEVAVFRIEGELYATSNICAHRGGQLAHGTLAGPVVSCPLHGWRYDVTTGKAMDIPGVMLARYPVRSEAGRIRLGSEPLSP